MKVYKVTQKKLEENLGESYIDCFHTSKSKRLRFISLIYLIAIPLNILLLWKFRQLFEETSRLFTLFQSLILVFMFLLLVMPTLTYFVFKHSFRQELSRKMKVLVNDPQLLWLNFKQGVVYPTEKKLVLKRYNYPLGEEAFYVMGYLKKHGTSSGLEWKNWKDSGTVRKRLKQLAERGVISEADGGHAYLPWSFRLIDEHGKFVETPHAQKVEKTLNRAWEKMLDEIQEEI